MSPKVFIALLVILAVACWYAAGVGITRDDQPDEDHEPTEKELSIGGFLDSLLAPFAAELDLHTLRPRQGAGFQFDPDTRKLTLGDGATCLLDIPGSDKKSRSAKLELTTGVSVAVVSWGRNDDKPADEKILPDTEGRDTVGLVFLEEGGFLQITNRSNTQVVLTFR
jgi:hypothetical protein